MEGAVGPLAARVVLGAVVEAGENSVDVFLGEVFGLEMRMKAVLQTGVDQKVAVVGGELPAVGPLIEGLEEDSGEVLGGADVVEELVETVADDGGGEEVADASEVEVDLVSDADRFSSHRDISISEGEMAGNVKISGFRTSMPDYRRVRSSFLLLALTAVVFGVALWAAVIIGTFRGIGRWIREL